MVFEYVSSAKEKEEKEAKAKLKKDQEKREMSQALEASFDRQTSCVRYESVTPNRMESTSSIPDRSTLVECLHR